MKKLSSYLTKMIDGLSARNLVTALGIGVAIALWCSSAFAQSGAGTIQGTVSDATGAVIPKAAINVVNIATGVAVDTKANNVGFYEVPGLFTGTYVVTVKAPNMETYKQTIELQVGQTFVADFALHAGSVSQQVTVAASSVQLVTTDNGVISATLENERINELPMNGRDVDALVIETTPGIDSGPESSASANGQMGAATEMEVDGTSFANLEWGGEYQSGGFLSSHEVDPDAVQETRVESLGAGAQYDSPLTIILTTKSGTNQLHGTMFETARNNGVGIARNRNNPSTFAAPKYVRNEFGISAGGPIIIPHLYHGKDKSFWFFGYERYSLSQDAIDTMTTPTQAMRNGDFSGLINSSGVLEELYNPYTTNLTGTTSCPEPTSVGTVSNTQKWCRTPFGGNPATGSTSNFIPSNLESPTAAIFNQMMPLPTNSNNPLVASNLSYPFAELNIEPQWTFRLDHAFNDNNRAYLRYTQNRATFFSNHEGNAAYSLAVPSINLPAKTTGESLSTSESYAASIGFTHIFSPAFYSETVLADTWMTERDNAGGDPNEDWEAKLGTPNNFGAKGFPEVIGQTQEIYGTQYQFDSVWSIPTFDENLTKTIGKHQLRFGGRYRYENIGVTPDQSSDLIEFDGLDTGLYNPSTGNTPGPFSATGDANADEFLGGAYEYSSSLQPPYQNIHRWEVDGYIQDDYRVRNNLNVNFGVRWEAHPAPLMGKGIMNGFDLKNDAIVLSAPTSQLISEGLTTQAILSNDALNDINFETPAVAGQPSKLVKNYPANILPRFGAAWQPFGAKRGTVLRGAVGRYINETPIRETYRSLSYNNPFQVGYYNYYNNAGYSPDSQQDYLLRSQPTTSASYTYAATATGGPGYTPVMGVNSTSVVNSTTTTALVPGGSNASLAVNFAPVFVNQANLTLEQPLKWNSVVRASYVYAHAQNLPESYMYNDWPSTYSWEIQTGTAPPTGAAAVVSPNNANTGEGPYDKLSWGSGSRIIQKTGWSNYNALQANYQRLFHGGSAWQILGVWAKSLRTGGDFGGNNGIEFDPYSTYVNSGPSTVTATPEGGTIGPINATAPPPPTGTLPWQYYRALNRWENYQQDPNVPWLHVQFNGLVALPFGHGQRYLSGAGKALNELVGGWQIAGDGGFGASEFTVNNGNWGPIAATGASGNSITHYKRNAPITDCRSGICLKSREYFNGYIAPTAISGNACSAGLANVVSGLPSGWVPFQTPIDTICSAPSGGKTVTDKYYGANDVIMNGVTGLSANTVVGYGITPSNDNHTGSGGGASIVNPFGRTILHGPMNFNSDLSVFKVLPITERLNLRVNVDAFNVFNIMGLNNPSGTDGTTCYSAGGVGCSSYNTPRQLQFTVRLSF